ncbi:hypothetical protein F2Q69_00059559 [Brassica cretica]|uniref:Uncharacterized protein n=1 Tax=Brassica cretica TaxID=69181 RepID=A0A8S9RI95_BRACR|nr:hypothetical protein F2Q69_00059559 [Brassica cretica]
MQSLDSSRSLSNPVSGKQPSGATRLSAGCDVHHGTMPCLTLENGFQIRDVQSLRTMSNIRIVIHRPVSMKPHWELFRTEQLCIQR